MVEIEEIQATEERQAQNDTASSSPPNEKDPDGWEKLMGDDLVMKIIDKSEPAGGKGPEPINPQDAVLVDFVGKVAEDKNNTDGPIFQQVSGWLVVVGEGDVLPCVEMAIRFMETGQTSRVWAHSKYAFGPGTRSYIENGEQKQLPPNSSVMFEIKVTMIVIDTSRLNPYFTIQKATTRKSIANDIYQHEWCPEPKSSSDPSCDTAMNRAIRMYTKAAKEMETLLQGTYFQQVEADHPQRGQTQQLLMDCLNNIVAVYLRQHEYHKAKQAAVEVLKQDPKNIKALLRAAKAALLDSASTMEEVQAALKAAEGEITYKNPAEEKQLKHLKVQFKRKQHEYKEQSKAMFGNKLQKDKASSSTDEANEGKDKGGLMGNDGTSKSEGELASETSKPRVSFDESTTKPPSTQGTEASQQQQQQQGAGANNNPTNFWKKQGMSMLFQVVLPLALAFLYRMVIKANRIGDATLEANRARMPEVEDPDVIDFD